MSSSRSRVDHHRAHLADTERLGVRPTRVWAKEDRPRLSELDGDAASARTGAVATARGGAADVERALAKRASRHDGELLDVDHLEAAERRTVSR